MERKLKWNKRALQHFKDQAFWYEVNRGHDFAVSFSENIKVSVDAIGCHPTMGRIEYIVGRRTYRCFSNHPHCKIFYWYTAREVRIVDIVLVYKLK
ncbi:MAG: type II toxin-antitoxin system RelE/ParE family toxin [Bacteroidaceae bacterium]|nr:type II toxin-antitoxin system RelE/ParE family toxin [Bacteroidaceae bacterium]